VPNAESERPDDLAWRDHVREGHACPAERRPFHTILTAQASLYQEWQTKIFYYHFRKAQRLGGRCTEMVGFTRLLAGKADGLMKAMPTVVVKEAGFDKTRGFMVINRPWTMLNFLQMKEWRERIVEDYVYIAETDHLLLCDIPNRATPQLAVAFFFPYMSPKDPQKGAIAQKWLPGRDVLDMPPVGPSPLIVHVDHLRNLTPSWYDLSVALKKNPEADRAFGWMLEMWGYSIAVAQLGIKHFVWQKLQIEPSAAWHQDTSSQEPFIYHYTFGVEYTLDGTPVVGAVGTWSLDKRHYFGAAPPANLHAPPACAQESGIVWWRMFNEAIGNLTARGQWYERAGPNLQSRDADASTQFELGALGKAIVETGPWLLDDKRSTIHFFRRGTAWSPWGGGKWWRSGPNAVTLKLCYEYKLQFDSETEPTRFTYTGGKGGSGVAHPQYRREMHNAARLADEPTGKTISRLLGEGPWHFGDSPLTGPQNGPFAFLRGGVLLTPSGPGSYVAIPDTEDVEMVVGGDTHRLTMAGVIGCYQFKAVRERDNRPMRGWVPMRGVSMEYTGWRDAWACTM